MTSSAFEPSRELSVADNFERAALCYADRIALCDGVQTLTFDQFNRAANRLARAIIRLIGPGAEPVALLFDPGIAPLVAVLAVLKAGKFCVPLDTGMPPQRLSAMLEDSGAHAIVHDGRLSPLAGELAAGSRITLDPAAAEGEDDHNLDIRTSPDDLVWLMYTSGTTGQPKGVMHDSKLCINGAIVGNDPPLQPDDRFALLTSYAFNVTSFMAFATLLRGASIWPFDLKRHGPRALADFITRHGITTFFTVTSAFRGLLAALAEGERLSSLRVARLGAEPITRRDFEDFARGVEPGTLVRFSLGSTEALGIAVWIAPLGGRFDGDVVPVGRPVEGLRVDLVDDAGAPVAPGEAGIMRLAGRYLSPGYWRRPELTAAAFGRDAVDPSLRTFRTADVARWLPDGTLVHLGRKDSQVKVRGQNVVLAEVEDALRGLPGVREAVVTARPSPSGDNRLAAYIVRADPALDAAAVRRMLAARILPHSVPSGFVFIETVPRLVTGKVDLRALPEPDWARPAASATHLAPRTPIEEGLAAIWSSVLGVERVGVLDDFLELGGDSLKSAQIVTRASNEFGVELAAGSVLDVYTVERMAQIVSARLAEQISREELTRLLDDIEGTPGA